MAQNGSEMEVAIVEVAVVVMVGFMALNQMARMVISSFFPGESKNPRKKLSKLECFAWSHWIRNYFHYFKY